MKNFSLKSIAALLMGVAVFSLTACNGGQDGDKKEGDKEKKKEKKEVTILYPNWAEGVAFTHLAKIALEDKNYEVTLKQKEAGAIYASLAKGKEADLFLDAWLPKTHKAYWEKYDDKLERVGQSFSNASSGLVVPKYVEVDSIKGLNEYAEKFGNKIFVSGNGSGIQKNTKKVIKKYNLDFEQVTSGSKEMLDTLKKAYKEKEPIVITGWKPHYKWSEYELKYLKDPKKIYPKDACTIISRKGFKGEYPKLKKFFSNFNLQENEICDLMGAIEKGENTEKAVKKWYKNHKGMIDSWWPREKAS